MRERIRKAYFAITDREGIRWRFTWDPRAKSLSMRMPRGLDYRITSEELVAALFMIGPDRRSRAQRQHDDRQLHLFTVPSCSPTPAIAAAP